MAYLFREIEQPKFSLKSGLLSALIFLLFLFWALDQTRFLDISLTPEELAKIQEQVEEQSKNMLFRFVESPEDEVEPLKDAALSDLTRKAKSIANKEVDPDNEDPFSKGDSFELKQRNLPESPPPSPQKVNPSVKPLTLDQVPLPSKVLMEPAPLNEIEKDLPELNKEREAEKTGKLPEWVGAPKPYRRPSKKELSQAREAAQQAIAKENKFRNEKMKREMKQYDNLGGRAKPSIGFSVDTAGHELGPYLKLFIQLVKGNWRIPNIARLEASGVTRIEFQLHQDGTISKARVLTESGFQALDTSSLNAIVNTHPAPPLPSHIKEDWIPIKFAFYYNMRPPRQ